MAKEDFCYTHYDGDEARDIAHMNRLERGGYTDIRLAQRKFGRLTLDRIRKILSKDFEEVWESIEAVLTKDDAGLYYIDWLEKSVEKSKSHSLKQKENVSKRWNKTDKSLPNTYQNDTNVLPNTQVVIPLENEYGNGNRKEEEGMGEEEKIFPAKSDIGQDLSQEDLNMTVVYLESTCSEEFKNPSVKSRCLMHAEIERMWKGFQIQYFNGEKSYDSWSAVRQHFRDWLKIQVKRNTPKQTVFNQERPEAAKALINDFYQARASQRR